jgi:hypothetical protein
MCQSTIHGMPTVRQSRFGPDLCIPHGGYPDRSLVSASDFRLEVSGAVSGGVGMPGHSIGEPTLCGSMEHRLSLTAQHSLTAGASTGVVRVSGAQRRVSEVVQRRASEADQWEVDQAQRPRFTALPMLREDLELLQDNAEFAPERLPASIMAARRGRTQRGVGPALAAGAAHMVVVVEDGSNLDLGSGPVSEKLAHYQYQRPFDLVLASVCITARPASRAARV